MITPIITAEELEALKKLPRHVPGKIIDLRLDELLDYLAVNNLQPDGMTAGGVLVVKRAEDE